MEEIQEFSSKEKLLFDGEYIKGKRWNGKANGYFEMEQIEFEGEYINGLKFGRIKEYYKNDKIKFEGKYLNGKRNGVGKNIIMMEKCYLKENI